MVDCRMCHNCYRIFRNEIDEPEDVFVCLIRKEIIQPENVRSGDCDVYVDSDDARIRFMPEKD